MKIHHLEPEFAIADSLSPEELADVKAQGFQSVICNRQAGEEGYEGEDAFARAAADLGLAWVCIPVASGSYSDADVTAFGQALDSAPSPILAFCRTGRRAVHMWAQARARAPHCNIPQLLKAAHDAGHDPQPIKELLDK